MDGFIQTYEPTIRWVAICGRRLGESEPTP